MAKLELTAELRSTLQKCREKGNKGLFNTNDNLFGKQDVTAMKELIHGSMFRTLKANLDERVDALEMASRITMS